MCAERAGSGKAPEVTDRKARSPGVILCEVCRTQAFKYKCPGCQLRCCSLACSKEHKSSTGCSGKRQRTSFVPLSEFGEDHLISDYNLLEEAAQLAESAQRTMQRTSNAENAQITKVRHMQHQARLRNMEWRAALPGSSARQLNSSCFDARKRRLMWRVTWRFEGSGYCVTDEKVDEQTKLGDALAAHLKLQPGQAQRHALLKEYVEEVGPEHLTLLLKQESQPELAPEYHRLMANHTLRLALAQKTITEFPTILVVLPRELPQYNIIKRLEHRSAVT